MWFRARVVGTLNQNSLGTGNIATFTLFDPTAVTAGQQDVRYTIRRILISPVLQITGSGGTGAANDVYRAAYGIYVRRTGESLPNPDLINPIDQDADWLWKAVATTNPIAGVPFTINNVLLSNHKNQQLLLDVKAQRRLDNKDQLVFLAQLDNYEITGTGHTLGASVCNGVIDTSVLYQRAMRH